MTLSEVYNWLYDQQQSRGNGVLLLSGFDHDTVPDVGGASYADDGNAVMFVVNGVAFCAREDPSDGYRSHMEDDIGVLPAALVRNRFEPVAVTVWRQAERTGDDGASLSGECDLLLLRDATSGSVVVEVGTDNTDDYYPRFIGSFYPEKMSVNVGVAAFSVPLRQPHDPEAPARGINLKGWRHGEDGEE